MTLCVDMCDCKRFDKSMYKKELRKRNRDIKRESKKFLNCYTNL